MYSRLLHRVIKLTLIPLILNLTLAREHKGTHKENITVNIRCLVCVISPAICCIRRMAKAIAMKTESVKDFFVPEVVNSRSIRYARAPSVGHVYMRMWKHTASRSHHLIRMRFIFSILRVLSWRDPRWGSAWIASAGPEREHCVMQASCTEFAGSRVAA